MITALALDQWVWYSFWDALVPLFILERLVGVWRSDVRGKLVAVTLAIRSRPATSSFAVRDLDRNPWAPASRLSLTAPGCEVKE